jgi:membrane protease YdiL (CAAX protease family)
VCFSGDAVEDWLLEFGAYLVLAVVGAAVLTAWWWRDHASRSWRLPMPRSRRISWYGIDVFAGFVLFEMIPALVDATLRKAGLFESLYPNADEQSPDKRSLFWSSTLAFPLVFGLMVLGLQQLRGTRPVELGLTRTRAAVNVRLGYFTWLVLTPPIYALMFAAVFLVELAGAAKTEHPVAEATKQSLVLIEWLLMLASTVVLMPVLEELLFRGLMLPWQLRGGWQAQLTTAFCALFFAGALGGAVGKTYNPAPLIFVLAFLPVLLVLPYLLLRHSPREQAVAEDTLVRPGWAEKVLRSASDRRAQPILAVCTNGLFFASLHSSIWPSPVPLLVLGIALAWVRYRSSSLVGSITLHALFNAVAALALVLKSVLDYYDP